MCEIWIHLILLTLIFIIRSSWRMFIYIYKKKHFRSIWKCQFSILTKENPNLLEWLLSVSGQPVLLLLLLLLFLKVKNNHRSKFFNLSNWKEEAWKKNQGFNGIRTRDLRVAGALLYQLSYEATHWERGQFIEFISPVRSEMMWRIWNNSFVNCGCRWKWRMIIAVNFPI